MINASPLAMGALTSRAPRHGTRRRPEVPARCARAAATCQKGGADLAKLALQFSVMTSPCVSTVVGRASPANVRRRSEAADAAVIPSPRVRAQMPIWAWTRPEATASASAA